MEKPKDNQENIDKCICEECSLHIGMKCTKDIEKEKEKLYCARTVSECKMGEGMCLCPGCEVYKENGLAGYAFCEKEIEIKK